MSIVLGGQRVEIPGVTSISWLDDPRALKTPKTNPRTEPIKMIVWHVTSTTPTVITPGVGPTSRDPFYWSRDSALNNRGASWDGTIRRDGVLLWHNDPLTAFTWHGRSVNPRSVGIEIESGNGTVYQAQIDTMVKLARKLSPALGVQEQIPWRNGAPDRRVIDRIAAGGQDVVGHIGHRNVTSEKSDPGDAVFLALKAAGFEGFDYQSGEDKQAWATRQQALGLAPDGVPGRATVAALTQAGYADGIWTKGKGSPLLWLAMVVAGGGLAYYAWSGAWR